MAEERTKVVINTFKDTGKWYDEIILGTDAPSHDIQKIISEVKKVVPQCRDMDFTIRCTEVVDGNELLNFRLVKQTGFNP